MIFVPKTAKRPQGLMKTNDDIVADATSIKAPANASPPASRHRTLRTPDLDRESPAGYIIVFKACAILLYHDSALSLGGRFLGPLRPHLCQHTFHRREHHLGIVNLDKVPGIWNHLVSTARGKLGVGLMRGRERPEK